MRYQFLRDITVNIKEKGVAQSEKHRFPKGTHEVKDEVSKHKFFRALVAESIAISVGDVSARASEAKDLAEHKAQIRAGAKTRAALNKASAAGSEVVDLPIAPDKGASEGI